MATEIVHVISDLHLGGAPAGPAALGFQLCPPNARARLARAIRAIAIAPAGERIELVINGDFVDFLAEESPVQADGDPTPRFAPFAASAAEAIRKLESVMRRAAEVFEALRAVVAAGHKLTILLGNHDVELALPEVRRALLEALTGGTAARVELVLDGEAYARRGVVIEHGNRYDGWNAIDHGGLRAFRSAVSRGEVASFAPPPGSILVTDIMNPLKSRYRFIDLLKPENEALIPILVAIEPDVRGELLRVAELGFRSRRAAPREGLPPSDRNFVAGASAVDPAETLEERALRDAEERTYALLRAFAEESPGPSIVSAGEEPGWSSSLRSLWHLLRAGAVDQRRLARLRRALVAYRTAIGATFALDAEEPRYLEAARRLSATHPIVVFGHTHLPKLIRLDRGAYLNTGTWCPTIRLDERLYDPSTPEPEAHALLERFVADLAGNRTDAWTRLDTFSARVVRGDSMVAAELLAWTDEGAADVVGSVEIGSSR